MTRSFTDRPIDDSLLRSMVDLASRAPSAGKTQGWRLVVLRGEETARFWDATLPAPRRAHFRWQGLLRAPVIALPLAEPAAYLDRYAQPDKARTGLGEALERWPAPYWTIDASMAVMTLLLAAEDAGLGALLFGVFHGEAALRRTLDIPADLQLLGAIALGWPDDTDAAPGLSAARPRRSAEEIIRWGRWT